MFQCPIFLPFHTVHGVPKARILKWFAIPFSSGPLFRPLHHDPPVLGCPAGMAWFHWYQGNISCKDGLDKGQKWYGPNFPGSHTIFSFIASDFTSISIHIHNWVLFLLWLHPFILSGVISPLISSSILGNYQPGVFIFQCPVFLPFHTIYGVLKARILKWFAIPFSSGLHSVFFTLCL